MESFPFIEFGGKVNRRQILLGATGTAAYAIMPRFSSLGAQISAPLDEVKAMANYRFGVAYYPEQWHIAQAKEDFAKMRDLGFNIVRMAEFAWSTMEPQPGKFQFEWLDRAIEFAAANHIDVVLGTPTASVPPWLYRAHPDVLSGNEHGPYTYGGRKGFAINSPAMRDAAEKVITRLCERYGKNPTVVGWQLSNEPGYPVVNYDPLALVAFRHWLQQHYSTLDALNAAWGGPFWSNEYGSWDEIQFPLNSAEGGWNPGVHLDYRRFFSDSFLEWLRFENKLVRKYAHNQFIFTNWPEVSWSVDIFKAAAFQDATAWDNYGTMPGTGTHYQVLRTAFNHDLCRASRADQRFFVSEQPTQPTSATDASSVRLVTWTDVAYGSHATLFFEFRAPEAGSEMAYTSMLEPDGSYGLSAPVLKKTFAEITQLQPKLSKTRTIADVALIYSYENSWDQGFRLREGPNVGAGYDNFAQRYYTGVKSLKRNVDIIPLDRDLTPYRMIVAPGLRLVSDDHAEQLRRWVHDGGILVLDHKAGTRTQEGRLRPLVEPGLFAEIAGVRALATEPLRAKLHTVSFGESSTLFSVADSEVLELNGAEPLALFHGSHLEGAPAVTLHAAGKGVVVFVSCSSRDDAFFDALFASIGHRLAIHPILTAPEGIDVVSRTDESTEYVFLINNTMQSATVPMPEPWLELLTNRKAQGSLILEPLQLAIIERSTGNHNARFSGV